MSTLNVCILAGESSGDLHASELITSLSNYWSHVNYYGIGGNAMQAKNVKLLGHSKDLAVIGLTGITKVLPKLIKIRKELVKIWAEKKPDCIIAIDYGGFNLKICKIAKKKNIPVYYYIPPKVWAWNKRRVHVLRKCTRKCFVINPFELSFYLKHGVDAIYAGNPSAYSINKFQPNSNFIKENGFEPNKKIIGIFPGSRLNEIKLIFPIYLEALKLISKQTNDYQFGISLSPNIDEALFYNLIAKHDSSKELNFKVIKNANFDLMAHSYFLILKSGTTTLEAGLFNKPMLVCYKMGDLSFSIAKRIIDVKYISLVNLNLKRRAVPELVQEKNTAENILNETLKYLEPSHYEQQLKELQELKNILGHENPAQNAAQIIQADMAELKSKSASNK